MSQNEWILFVAIEAVLIGILLITKVVERDEDKQK